MQIHINYLLFNHKEFLKSNYDFLILQPKLLIDQVMDQLNH